MNSMIPFGCASENVRPPIAIPLFSSGGDRSEGPIETVPDLVFKRILFYLMAPQLEASASVSKKWSIMVVQETIRNKIQNLHSLSRFLVNQHSNTLINSQHQGLIESEKSMSMAKGLKEIKFFEQEWKHRVAEALNQLPEEDVLTIYELRKNQRQTSFSPHTDGLNPLYPKPVKMKAITLKGISKDLTKLGLVDLACVISEGISLHVEKSKALLAVSKELVDEGRTEEAVAAAMKISLQLKQSEALLYVIESIVKIGQLFDAERFADLIPLDKYKKEAHSFIAKATINKY